MITADHKVFSEVNPRTITVVQDLATQWIQYYPCEKQEFAGNVEDLRKFRESSQKLEDFSDNLLDFLKNLSTKYHGIIERPRLIRQKRTELQNDLYDE